jgi:undecaprenyl-diphosphatase
MLAAGAKELYDAREKLAASDQLATMGLATAVAAVVGYVCVAWLIGFLKKFSMNVFVGYRVALAVVLLVLAAAGLLKSAPHTDSSATVPVVSPPAESSPP